MLTKIKALLKELYYRADNNNNGYAFTALVSLAFILVVFFVVAFVLLCVYNVTLLLVLLGVSIVFYLRWIIKRALK